MGAVRGLKLQTEGAVVGLKLQTLVHQRCVKTQQLDVCLYLSRKGAGRWAVVGLKLQTLVHQRCVKTQQLDVCVCTCPGRGEGGGQWWV